MTQAGRRQGRSCRGVSARVIVPPSCTCLGLLTIDFVVGDEDVPHGHVHGQPAEDHVDAAVSSGKVVHAGGDVEEIQTHIERAEDHHAAKNVALHSRMHGLWQAVSPGGQQSSVQGSKGTERVPASCRLWGK